MGDWQKVAAVGEIPSGGLRVLLEDEEILLVKHGDEVSALSYLCSHQEMPLEGGHVSGDAWVCPHHGARFSLKSGEALAMPAVSGINIFLSKVDGGFVYIKC